MQNKIQNIGAVALWLFLCCYFMQLFNFPNKITLLIGGIVIFVLMRKQKRVRIDLMTVLLVLTIASYFLIVHGQRAFTMSLSYVSIIIFVLAYYLGCEVREQENPDKLYIALLLTIVVGYSVRGILNSYLFLDGQFQYPNNVRVWRDIWADWYMPGTWQVIFFLPVISCVFPAIAYIRKRKWFSILLLANAVFFLYISMASQTRTPVIIFPLILCAQLLLYLILEWKNVHKLFTKRNVILGLVIIVVLFTMAFIVFKDNEIIAKFLSIMGRDGGILKNIRFQLHKQAIEQLFDYPLGGKQMFLTRAHPHNTWLDMAYLAGVIPFWSFVFYTGITIYELLRWLFIKDVSTERKLIMAGIYGSFFVFFVVERSFVGSVHYLTPWLFITGMIHGELRMIKDKLKRR